MKTVIALAALVALCYAAPQEGTYDPKSPYFNIVKQNYEIGPDGSYLWAYETGDGTAAQAKGSLKNAGIENGEAEVVEGSYSYISPEGIPITVTYTADEFGFHPKGEHLP